MKIQKHLKVIALIFTIFSSLAARSATIEISYRNGDPQKPQYRISGSIVSGDYSKFFSLVTENRSVGVSLNSNGGDLFEAIRIGELVKQLGLRTSVYKEDICASACFFIWLQGNTRYAAKPRPRIDQFNIGLHRPYLINPSNDNKSLDRQKDVQRSTIAHLEDNMIPRRLIDIMMTRPSNEIYWLTQNDIDELGEYTPHVEELLISKCKYSRKDFDNEFTLRYELNRIAEADALKSKIDASEECAVEILAERFFKLRQDFLIKKKSKK